MRVTGLRNEKLEHHNNVCFHFFTVTRIYLGETRHDDFNLTSILYGTRSHPHKNHLEIFLRALQIQDQSLNNIFPNQLIKYFTSRLIIWLILQLNLEPEF